MSDMDTADGRLGLDGPDDLKRARGWANDEAATRATRMGHAGPEPNGEAGRVDGPCWAGGGKREWAKQGRKLGCAREFREHYQTSEDGLSPIGKKDLIIS